MELVAPAGDREKLETALLYGADSVYLGLQELSLRAQAGNFSRKELPEVVEFVHQAGRKVYVALNAFLLEADLPVLEHNLKVAADAGADAVIISDPAALELAGHYTPGLELHLSTQANVTNSASARFWEGQGIKRLILARELTLEDLQAVRAACTAELEVFVHGARCMAYSGRCMLSEYLTGRRANAGDCAHPCRYEYTVVEAKRPHESFPVIENERGTQLFSSRDLCLVERLPELAAVGVDAIKIEGRTKSLHYVAAVTRAYREALLSLQGKGRSLSVLARELEYPSHRPYTEGFLTARGRKSQQVGEAKDYLQERLLVAKVIEATSECKALVEVRNKLVRGAELQLLPPLGREVEFKAVALETETGVSLSEAKVSKQLLWLHSEPAVPFAPGLLITRKI